MKKKLVSLVLCMALLSSLTVSASAEFTSSDSSTLSDIYSRLGTVLNNQSASYKVLSWLYSGLGYQNNTSDTLSYHMKTLLDRVSGISTRIVEVQTLITGTNNRVDTTNSRLSTINTNMQNLIAAFSSQNHSDITAFKDANHTDLTAFADANHTDITDFAGLFSAERNFYAFSASGVAQPLKKSFFTSWFDLYRNLNFNGKIGPSSDRTLYSRLKQLQEVLASDDDLALKNANKANEAAVKSGFVNGSSSKTSLGASDFGNLKDVGGTFNDLTSLNGQAKVSSFLSGLSSADEVGQGWFSEACRASLDAVSQPASSGTRLVQKTWRGEKSLIYTLEADTSVVGVKSVAGVAGSDLDPYNMAGFTDNYNWLWGDAP